MTRYRVGWDLPATTAEPVNQEAEGDEPGDGDDEIRRPVDKGAAEGEEPDDGEQDAQSGHHDRVDVSALLPARHAISDVEIARRDTEDDGGEGQLRQAEDHGDEVDENHLGGCIAAIRIGLIVNGAWFGETGGKVRYRTACYDRRRMSSFVVVVEKRETESD